MTARTFITRRDTVMECLDDVEAFLDKIAEKAQEYPNRQYEHEISIGPSTDKDHKWEIELILVQYEDDEVN